MIELTRPMLAAPTKPGDWPKIKFPVLASPKIDGIRAICVDGVLMSRSMKPIPNVWTQRLFGSPAYNGLDGELVVGSPTDPNCMQNTSSGVMSRDGEPDVSWHVFDRYDYDAPFGARYLSVKQRLAALSPMAQLVPHCMPNTIEELMAVDEYHVGLGYEGTMVRSIEGPYKQGRGTFREGYLLKIKRFEDGEAEVVGVDEQMHNANEATVDERGYTKRSTRKDGKIGAGVLGSLIVKDAKTGEVFGVGTGFTLEQRHNLWEGRKYLIGKLVKYRHFPVGRKDAPRFPTFVGFRDRRDM